MRWATPQAQSEDEAPEPDEDSTIYLSDWQEDDESLSDLDEAVVDALEDTADDDADSDVADEAESAWEGYGSEDAYTYGGEGPCGRFWVRGEVLGWWTKGMNVPPLVTTSPPGTPRAQAGVIGQPGTQVLFGGTDFFDGDRWGGRLRIGMWKDCCRAFGVTADWAILDNDSAGFLRGSQGDPILARPFFNAVTNLPDSQLVAYPNVVVGSVSVESESAFQTAGVGGRMLLHCEQSCDVTSRLDVIAGYRFMKLDESIRIQENLTAIDGNFPVQFDIFDLFDTQSDFHGGEIGLIYERSRGGMSVEVLAKVAFGNSHDRVSIDGGTNITAQGVTTPYVGGLLAQTTNIGVYEQDRFAVVPEFGVTFGYDINCNWRATLGYTLVYWSSVVRPGDQIDTRVNPNLLPPPNLPLVGPAVPVFAFHETDFWAQGLSLGLEFTY